MADAMTLAARGPLDGRAAPAIDGFALAKTPDCARVVLRAAPTDAQSIDVAFGAAPSPRPMRAAERDARAALWLGPDEWLLLAPGETAESLARQLEIALAETPHSLVDVSHRQIGLDVGGPLAARALNAGCPLDLSVRAFPVGMATRTLLGKCEIVLWRRGPERFHAEVWRSFADYAWDFLVEAARRAPRE